MQNFREHIESIVDEIYEKLSHLKLTTCASREHLKDRLWSFFHWTSVVSSARMKVNYKANVPLLPNVNNKNFILSRGTDSAHTSMSLFEHFAKSEYTEILEWASENKSTYKDANITLFDEDGFQLGTFEVGQLREII